MGERRSLARVTWRAGATRRSAAPWTRLGCGGYSEPVLGLGKDLDKFLEGDQDRALFDLAPRGDIENGR